MGDDKKEELFTALNNLTEAQLASRKDYEIMNEAWWKGLSEEERENAFYAVCKRMHKAELVDRGTYRYVLYDVFGFDMNMYGRGMECGFMAIHNAIYGGDKGYNKLYDFVRYIATDYIELSYEKVKVQRDDYIRMAKKLLEGE